MKNYTLQEQEKQQQKNLEIYSPVWTDNIFSDFEIQQIIQMGEKELNPAYVGNGLQAEVNSSIRKTLISWIGPDNSPSWLIDRIISMLKEINEKHFYYELTGAEPAQYTKYDGETNGEYKWHADIMPVQNDIRKLSVSILLSDPLEYEGGNLILAPHGNPITIGDKKSRAIFFPSWVPHCVTPVTKGIRKSLVIWAHGPAFK
jgi:PKHD-type hydroxylase